MDKYEENVGYKRLIEKIDDLLASDSTTVIVGIDGRCGSGKSTLASCLQEKYDCSVFHMDDYFLRPEQRSQERLSTPGENVDHERFLNEILLPLTENKDVKYQRYNCHTQSLDPVKTVLHRRLNIIEGAYCFHPELYDYYDLKVFLDVDEEVQKERIIKRNSPDAAEMFFERWIPFEEKYIRELDVINKADLVLRNS